MDSLTTEFVGNQSYHFMFKKNNKTIDFHLHLGGYQYDFLHIIISDRGIMVAKDVKFLNYINEALVDFDVKLGSIFGFLSKGHEREVSISVNCNSIKINYAPVFYNDDEYKSIMKNLSDNLYKNIKSMNLENFF